MSKSLFAHAAVSNTAGVFVSASTSTRTIDAATVTNTSAGAVTLTLWQVPASGSRADANIMLDALSVDAGATVALAPLVNHAIAANATIHAEASAATSLTLMVSGRSQ
jgi:hypothetical protein